jgi:hypothetical protein
MKTFDDTVRMCVQNIIIIIVIIIIIIIMALQPFVGPWPFFFSFLILYTVGRTPWTGDQPSQGLYPCVHKLAINTCAAIPRDNETLRD